MNRNHNILFGAFVSLQKTLILTLLISFSLCFDNNAVTGKKTTENNEKTRKTQLAFENQSYTDEDNNPRTTTLETERTSTEDIDLATEEILQCLLQDRQVLRYTTAKLSLLFFSPQQQQQQQEHNRSSPGGSTDKEYTPLVCQVVITAPGRLELHVRFIELSCSSSDNSVSVFEGDAERAVWNGCESVREPSAVSDLVSRSGRVRLVLTVKNLSLLSAVRMNVRARVSGRLFPPEVRMISSSLGNKTNGN